MDDYKPNSHRFKEGQKKELAPREEKNITKVVKGAVKTKKKSEVKKLTDVFISEDAHNVKSYILMDVLVPAIKKAVKDIVTDGIEMILYGESGRGKTKSSASYISYNKYSDRRDEPRRDRHVGRGYDFDDIYFDNRGEAEEVLTRMDELMDTYRVVSVADFYDLVGVSCEYTDNKYGWTNIRNAEVTRTRDGYTIKLPKALPIN